MNVYYIVMANKVYFISEQYLKDNTSISMNVEPQLLNIAIQDAQNIHIQPLLGGTLYKKLCDLIVDGTIGATGNEKYNVCFSHNGAEFNEAAV